MKEEKMVTLALENGGTITIPEKCIAGIGFRNVAQPAPFGGPFGCPVNVYSMYYVTILTGTETAVIFVTKESLTTAAEIYERNGKGK